MWRAAESQEEVFHLIGTCGHQWEPDLHLSKKKTNEGRNIVFQIKHLTDWKRRWIKKLSKQTMTSAATDAFLLLRAGERNCQEIRQESFFSPLQANTALRRRYPTFTAPNYLLWKSVQSIMVEGKIKDNTAFQSTDRRRFLAVDTFHQRVYFTLTDARVTVFSTVASLCGKLCKTVPHKVPPRHTATPPSSETQQCDSRVICQLL